MKNIPHENEYCGMAANMADKHTGKTQKSCLQRKSEDQLSCVKYPTKHYGFPE